MNALVELSATDAIRLRNTTCCYCGVSFCAEFPSTKEHVIGTRFVPLGSLNGTWNLILNACKPCNNAKSDLEDDISAITMQPTAYGDFAVDDPRLPLEAARKAKSRSRLTKKPVGDSHEEIELTASMGTAATLTMKFMAGPQVAETRVYLLAEYHFRAFFYLLTWSEEKGRGWRPPGGFFPWHRLPRSDWGCAPARWLMEATAPWTVCFIGIAAEKFFKIVIRQMPGVALWVWALEWNQSMRVMGFAGDEAECDRFLALAPLLRPDFQSRGPDGQITTRRENVPLDDADDTLFVVSVEVGPGASQTGQGLPS